MASPARPVLAGKWRGGPHNTTITITVSPAGEVYGCYACPSGALGEFLGRLSRGLVKGTWTDAVLAGSSKRSELQKIELTLGGSGEEATLRASGTTVEGAPVQWTATRIAAKLKNGDEARRPVYRNKEVFERLTKPKYSKELAETVRQGVLLQYAAPWREAALGGGAFCGKSCAATRRVCAFTALAPGCSKFCGTTC